MLPSGTRLYTWVDVEEVFSLMKEEEQWPSWLVMVKSYWDGITLFVSPIEISEVRKYLAQIFELRFESYSNESESLGEILLESQSKSSRSIEVTMELMDSPPPRRTVLTWGKTSPLARMCGNFPLESLSSDTPSVVCFHSFKGGVGRTLLATALTRWCVELGRTPLLIDADFEAPGISWLIRERITDPIFSVSDLLALLHSEVDDEMVLALAGDRAKNMQVDGAFVLPAFRSLDRLRMLEIRPEHISQGATTPYILTEFLGKFAKRLGADVVIVDLRAGFSELSAGLMLDPRVHRIVVSTLGGQSIVGAQQIVSALARLAPSTNAEEPVPAVVLSQIPRNQEVLGNINDKMQEVTNWIQQATTSAEETIPVFTTLHDPTLSVLPADWNAVVESLSKSDYSDVCASLANWIGLTPKKSSSTVAASTDDLTRQRRRLAEWSKKMIYAERGIEHNLLFTESLRSLVSLNISQLPIAVIVGAKGAGKTYTYLQLNYKRTWSDFAQSISDQASGIDAVICPVLQPKNLDAPVLKELAQRRNEAAAIVGGIVAQPSDLQDLILDSLKKDLHESEWRAVWLRVIAMALGLPNTDFASISKHLRMTGKRILLTFDGLEDIFQTLSNNPNQQVALRALIQDVPEYFVQQQDRVLGFIVFIREDMVLDAVKQNAKQLMHKYDPYALRWNYTEALRLVVWMCAQCQTLFDSDQVYRLTELELKEELSKVWGRKLGTDKSREARSSEWVLSVLQGTRNLIQARDMVRLIAESATRSIGADSRWDDRLLVPSSLRDSLATCSKEKVEETKQENPVLRPILNKLQEMKKEDRYTPFDASDIPIDPEDLKILEAAGVIIRDRGQYEMPEIFRHGLQFERRGLPGRARILRNAPGS